MKWDAVLYDAVKSPRFAAGLELMALASVQKHERVLDIGCGTGSLTARLAALASEGIVTGIDASPEMIDKAGRAVSELGNVNLVLQRAEEMGFSHEFDLAFSNMALQWMPQQREVLGRVFQALRPCGRIAFQIPASRFSTEFFEYIEDAIQLLGYERYFAGWESPWYFPDEDEYHQMLAALGFGNIRVFCRDSVYGFETNSDCLSWLLSAGLRPYLAALPDDEAGRFTYAVAMNFEKSRTASGIELGFRRLLAFASGPAA